MIGARLFMRLRIKRQTFQASDAFLCLAWIASVTTASFDIIFFQMGILDENVSLTLVGYAGTAEEKTTYAKVCIMNLSVPIQRTAKDAWAVADMLSRSRVFCPTLS